MVEEIFEGDALVHRLENGLDELLELHGEGFGVGVVL